MIVRTGSVERTRELGQALGGLAKAGTVVILIGELGAGETTFTQGLGEALGVREPVTSPTFVVAREHRGEREDLVHVDAYRVHSLHEWDDLDLDYENGVFVVEWGDRVLVALPEDHLEVRFQLDDDARTLEFTARGPASRELLAAFEAAT